MTKREAREIALERRVGRIDATARDAGHRPESWSFETTSDASLASTRCACGATAAVRIEEEGGKNAGLVEWQAGKLAWRQPQPCATEENMSV